MLARYPCANMHLAGRITAVEPVWHIKDSQGQILAESGLSSGQILALALWYKTLKRFKPSIFARKRGEVTHEKKGTSLRRKRTPLGPYRRPMPRILGGS